jgi:hypothetical protein
VTAIAAISITWGILVGLLGRPATGPWSVVLIGVLALSVAQWVGFRATRSVAQIIRDIDTEPRFATLPVTMGGAAAVSMKGSRAL